MTDEVSAHLLERVREGDQQAADELFNRYLERLIKLAQSRLSDKLGRRIDAEDIVQSAYRSFFSAAHQGRFVLQRSGDLWSLLAAITLNKLRRQVKHHGADKRSYATEQSTGGGSERSSMLPLEAIAEEPSPAEAAALVDQLQHLMADLDPRQRRMLEMRLQGYTVAEIAKEAERSERAVHRLLTKVRETLQQSIDSDSEL